MGLSHAYDSASRKLAKKLTLLKITKEEYVLMKAMLLFNPGTYTSCVKPDKVVILLLLSGVFNII